MTLICFKLSMPNRSSWNGAWSGQDNLYALVKNVSPDKANTILKEKSFYYNFGDGWGASISIDQIDSKEAAKVRRKSKGFAGYDWMVSDILVYGEILGTLGRKAKGTQNA